MKDPPRLVEQSGLGAQLLRSAEGGRAPAHARRKAAAAVGAAFLAARTASATAGILGGSLGVKVVVGVGAALAIGGAAAHWVVRAGPDRASNGPARVAAAPAPERADRAAVTSATPLMTALPPAPAGPAPVVSEPVAAPAPSVVNDLGALVDAPKAAPNATPRTVQRSAPARTAEEPSVAPAPGLLDELQLLEAAKRALAAGDAGAAMVALDRYDQRFSAGHLAPEAEALRIAAIARSGDCPRAAARARQFLAQHPDSPLVDRVRGYADTAP